MKNFLLPQKLIFPVTLQWAIHTFTMVMDGLICEYRNSMYRDDKIMKKLE